MKTLLFAASLLATAASAMTYTSLPEADAKHDLSLVSDVQELERITTPDSGTTMVKLVTLNIEGAHTDVSPSAVHYLVFHHVSEFSIRRSVFWLAKSWGIKSAVKTAPGVYEIKYEVLDEIPSSVHTIHVDVNQLLADDKALVPTEFEDKYLMSSIRVTK